MHYSVTILEIGYIENQPQSFYLGDFADPGKVYDVHPFTMTLVQGGGKNILIDSGIDSEDPVKQAICKDAGIGHVHSPKEILATVDLTPEDIDAIILTHLHFDHAGALECYPNAKIYLQRREYEGWKEWISSEQLSALGNFSVDPEDVKRIGRLDEEGRIEFIYGDKQDLFPDISVAATAFGHSFGSQMVLIESDGVLLVHAGDVAYIPENLTGTETFPFYIPNTKFSVGSPYYTIMDYDRLYRWTAGHVDKIIMSHDTERRNRYPGCIGSLGLGIFRII